MDIRCPSCSKLFRVADEKIAGKGIRFKCSKCSEVITITKDDFEMDLLAREGENASPAPLAAAPAPPQPSAPPPKAAAPEPPAPAAEPEAREYKPPVESSDEPPAPDQQLPAASLGDFDFSEPHAAATAAAHPAEGFGGDFSFEAGQEQEQAAPEIEISPEAAAEAEAALSFSADLISEPKRKAAFAAPAEEELAAPSVEPPQAPGAEASAAEEELDLGAALAMPKEPEAAAQAAPAQTSPAPGAAAQPAGPVLTPELLAQMKRAAPPKPAAQAQSVPAADEEMDLGAALSIPRGAAKGGDERKSPEATKTFEPVAAGSGKRIAFYAAASFLLAAAGVGALYVLDMLPGISKQQAQEQAAPQKPAQTKELITPAGLVLEQTSAYFSPGTGDLVITGAVRNTTSAAKRGWYLEIDIIDAAQKTLATVRILNGTVLLGKREQEILVKRGESPEKLAASAGQAAKTSVITAGGNVAFEVKFPAPPQGSASIIPSLKTADPDALLKQQAAAK